MRMIGRDGWAGLVILAFCACLWWMTLGLKDNPLVPIGPGFYPRIVIGVPSEITQVEKRAGSPRSSPSWS